MKRFCLFGMLVLVAACVGATAYGQSVSVGKGGEFEVKTLAIPYAFYNEHFHGAAGVVGFPEIVRHRSLDYSGRQSLPQNGSPRTTRQQGSPRYP